MLRTTLRNAKWSSQYEPKFIFLTQDEQITGHNLWLLNRVETLHTSHNLHTHTGTICHSEPQLKEYHVLTLYPEPQLKGCHSEPQLKECSSKVHPLGIHLKPCRQCTTKGNKPLPLHHRLALPKCNQAKTN